MVRVSDITAKCESCENLVRPEDPRNRLKLALVGAFITGVVGFAAGTTIGIATAGIGIVATYPLAAIGTYAGWRSGILYSEWKYDYTCPSCGFPFRGEEIRTKLAKVISGDAVDVPSRTNDPADGETSERATGQTTEKDGKRASTVTAKTNTVSGDPFGSDFTIAFSCRNCGNDWEKSFESGSEVMNTQDGVALKYGSSNSWIVCPTCDSQGRVSVEERLPNSDTSADMSMVDMAGVTGVAILVLVFGFASKAAVLGIVGALATLLFGTCIAVMRAYI